MTQPDAPDYARSYDAYYYAHGCGLPYQRTKHWLDYFGAIADRIIATIGPRTVMDAGCALGILVEALRTREVECYGVDVSEYAISQVHASMRPYCTQASIVDPFPRRYDLIVCSEIVEHMPPAEGPAAIANLCRHSDDILFSASPVDFREVTHLNVQPPEVWAELFAGHGFFRDVDYDAGFLQPWAARFRRRQEPVTRLARDYERRFWLLWQENVELRNLNREMRSRLADIEQAQAGGTDPAQLRADVEWLQEVARQRGRGGWRRALGAGWERLNALRVLENRLVRRLPSVTTCAISQTFVAEHDNLGGVSVFMESRPGGLLAPLRFTLTEADYPEHPVATRLVSPRQIPTLGALALTFEPLGRSAGQTYRLTFDVPGAGPGDELYLWSYPRSCHPERLLRRGDETLPGELILSATYGLPPDIFADDWRPRWTPSSLLNPATLLRAAAGAAQRGPK